MRRWRRVQTADGARFVSALEPHEVALLKNMATSIQEMLDDRQAGSPSDPLEEITGIRTGNPKPPEDATLSRLLPGFVKDSQAGQATPAWVFKGGYRHPILPTKDGDDWNLDREAELIPLIA